MWVQCGPLPEDVTTSYTTDELAARVGHDLKNLRLQRNIDQRSLAERAGISVRALKNLENGRGSTLNSLVAVARALGREAWLLSVAPAPSINPLHLTATAEPRKRAGRPRKPRDEGGP